MPDSQTLMLIIAATVAAVVLFRLYTVLGRRTGHEPPPMEARALPQPDMRAPAVPAPAETSGHGLIDIQLADRGFDKAHFLEGARTAYQMIQKAFAEGDRLALKPLLSDDVYHAFEDHLAGRGGPAAETLAGITDARIAGASLHDRVAEITVAFRAQFSDGKSQRDINDVWTFARPIGATDPNWVLVATSGEAA